MPFELTDLPYAKDALVPHISEETVNIHYEKHHGGYVKKLNAALEGSKDADKSLEALVKTLDGSLFNLAAQVWNHDFYWTSLAPNGGGQPEGELAQALSDGFGSFAGFTEALADAANGEFGSGWAWLVADSSGKLKVLSSSDADTPLRHDLTPLLTIDVWEHAYYVDYRNERGRYVDACINHLLNWEVVGKRFAAAGASD